MTGQSRKALEVGCREAAVGEQRRVKLFRIGRTQVVRIPLAFAFQGDEAIMRREGDRLVIEPVRKRELAALLASITPADEAFAEIDDPPPTPDRIF